ncbi:unnamed protein product [Prunus brigantina]
MGRAPCCDKANVKKGPWSPEEDSKLKEYIEKKGTGGNWIALPQKAGLKRCGKSCRLRWLNYLRPNIKHGEFSDEEDRIICSLFASIGSRWSIIAAQLPGRTDNDIKNYWNTKLKKKLMGMHMAPPSHHHHHHQRNSLKPPPFPSSSHHNYQNQPLIPSQPLSSLFKDLSSTYNRSFSSGFEIPHLSMTSNNFSNATTNSSLFPTQECLVGSMQVNNYPVKKNSNQNNLLMFGSEGSCSTSSDGSCNQISYDRESNIKQEEMVFQSFDQDQNNQRFMMLNYGNNNSGCSTGSAGHDHHHVINQWCERPDGFDHLGTENTLGYCDLEDVKQLISGGNNLNIGVNGSKSNSLFSNVDENKTEEKVMYFY